MDTSRAYRTVFAKVGCWVRHRASKVSSRRKFPENSQKITVLFDYIPPHIHAEARLVRAAMAVSAQAERVCTAQHNTPLILLTLLKYNTPVNELPVIADFLSKSRGV